MLSFTQRSIDLSESSGMLRLSLKCSQSSRLNNYKDCSIGNCGGNEPISNTTADPCLKKRKDCALSYKVYIQLYKILEFTSKSYKKVRACIFIVQ